MVIPKELYKKSNTKRVTQKNTNSENTNIEK